jgi:phosphoribosylformylglycinamidine (FGAM) synthase-like amidotransferase family enzyme
MMIWSFPKSDLVVLPGGFSYGDYLRCGSMASKSKIMQSVINFAKGGGKVMGFVMDFRSWLNLVCYLEFYLEINI